jgi:hypothetical protein
MKRNYKSLRTFRLTREKFEQDFKWTNFKNLYEELCWTVKSFAASSGTLAIVRFPFCEQIQRIDGLMNDQIEKI